MNLVHTHLRPLAIATGLTIAAVSLAACGSSSSSTGPISDPMASMDMSPAQGQGGTQPGMKSMIMIKNYAFSSPESVEAGSTVMVMNEDSETHTVTADGSGGFDVTVPPGATKTFTAPSQPGSYPYHCSFHSQMHGTLTVR